MEFWTSGFFWGISSFLELRDVKRPLGAPLEIPPPQYVRHYLVMSSAKKTHCVPALLPATPHIAAFTPSITLLNISSWHKGASIYDVRKIFGFVDPLPPLLTNRNQLMLFLLSAFWGPTSSLPVRTSYMEGPKPSSLKLAELMIFLFLLASKTP